MDKFEDFKEQTCGVAVVEDHSGHVESLATITWQSMKKHFWLHLLE